MGRFRGAGFQLVFLVAATMMGLGSCVRGGFGVSPDSIDRGPSGDRGGDSATADVSGRDLAKVDLGNNDMVSPPGDFGAVAGTWVTIPAGTFPMGAPASEPCRFAADAQHQVTLTHGFEIQATEVTQGQFVAAMGYNPSLFSSCGPDCPVETVSWYELAAYCNALSARRGYAQCYECSGTQANIICSEAPAYAGAAIHSCPGYRFPTEAEWEYAYRAGTTTAYYNGPPAAEVCTECSPLDPNLDVIAWYCGNSGNTPHPVGLKLPNAWGLHDMAGNVWEWCQDWWQDDLGSTPMIDPIGAISASGRITRGGSWNWDPDDQRAGARSCAPDPTFRIDSLGGRCARTR